MFHLSILVRKISGLGFSSLSSCGIAWLVVRALAINRYKNNKRLEDENQQYADLDNFNEWQGVA